MKALDHIGSAFLRRILRRMKQLGVNQSELAKRMKVSKAVHHQGPSPGRELLLPHGGEIGPCSRNGLHSQLAGAEALTDVNQKVYNTPHQMTVRTDSSDYYRYSAAYAMGRERIKSKK